MNKEEILEMIRTIKASTIGFNLDPERACGAWFKILGQYTRREAWDAISHILGNSDRVPTAHMIRDQIGAQRYRDRKESESRNHDKWKRDAVSSFDGIPGANRGEQIAYICGQQSAKHWIDGERDNDFYNSRLLDARKIGIEFEGVDYSQVHVSNGYECKWFNNMAAIAGK